jgi:hypothetical protein
MPSLRLPAHGFRVEKRRPGHPYELRSVTMASRTTTSGGDYNLSDPVDSFVEVVRRVVLQPVAFFAGLPRQGSFLGPLVFALICVEISAVLIGLLTFVGVPGGITWLFGARGDQGFLAFVGGLVITPIAATVGIYLSALVTHLLVILVVGAGHSGFGATFRIVSYSSVTSLLGWIPFIGWIFSLYQLYLATVGIREMHGTTTGRALLVVLLPAILILVLVVVLVGASAIVYFRAA